MIISYVIFQLISLFLITFYYLIIFSFDCFLNLITDINLPFKLNKKRSKFSQLIYKKQGLNKKN